MVRMEKFKNRSEWLEARRDYIGGSEVAAIVGLNPYCSNVELWERKTGRLVTEDSGENPFTEYGRNAEAALRDLFKLDFPDYEVEYVPDNMWHNDKYPFAHASLDGWMRDSSGRLGVLEIKTTSILKSMQKEKWRDRIPDNYYCQVLWYMGVVEADFACLKAQLKYVYEDDVMLTTRHYWIERKDVQDDIDLLMEKGAEFAEYLKKDIRPNLVLPEL